MGEPLFIGIDGGGTLCRARLVDDRGRLLGEGAGGPANVRLEPALVMRSILTASVAAAEAAALREADLTRVNAGMGLAGAWVPNFRARLLAEPNPFASIAIETDAYVAWLGAHAGRNGAILILGTGSCGLAVVDGDTLDVSGYGAEVGDEASGRWIGSEAVRRALWAHDGRASMTPLAAAILARLGGSPEAIVDFATGASAADFAALAPLVLDHAGQRDALGLALVTEAAADAVRMINRLLEFGAPSVSLIGGLAVPLSDWLPPPIRERLSPAKGDALDGAILMARRAVAADAAAHA